MKPTHPYSDPVDQLARMLLVRAYEDRIAALAAAGPFPASCPSAGQEAAAVGVVSALGADDLILTNHRSAGHLLARGADPGRLLAEVMGRETGYCRGRSGSLHISAKELGVVLTSTIVGGELSLAPGVALARSLLGRPGIVTCFFGDGAACEGIFHESINLASVWNLPVLYVCENNEWQAYVHRRETMLTDSIAAHAAAYGVEGRSVDGNDVAAVHAAALAAAAQVRASGRPFLLEARTYRARGHLEPDDQSHVDAGELAHWQARDPIALARERLIAAGQLDLDGFARLVAEARARIDAAVEFAVQSPYPDPAELLANVYA